MLMMMMRTSRWLRRGLHSRPNMLSVGLEDGHALIPVPLPRGGYYQTIRIRADASVRDLFEEVSAVRGGDSSSSSDIRLVLGNARPPWSLPVRELIRTQWALRFGQRGVQAEYSAADATGSEFPGDNTYEMLKEVLRQRSRSSSTLSHGEFALLCQQAAAQDVEDEDVHRWLRALERAHVIAVEWGSSVSDSADRIHIQWPEDLTSALDVRGMRLHEEIAQKEEEIARRTDELAMVDAALYGTEAAAAKQVRAAAWAAGGLMLAQYGVIFHKVWFSASWDVMEPICYFLSSGYTLLFLAYSLQTGVEPTFYNNVWGQLKRRRQAAIHVKQYGETLEECETKRDGLKETLEELGKDIRVLRSRQFGVRSD